MKKLFLLLAMVGLAAASCTPNGKEPGSNEGGSDEFAIEVTNIGEYGATVTVTPKDETRTYYWSVTRAANIKERGGYDAWLKYVHESNQESVENGHDTWVGEETSLLSSGESTYTFTTLNPSTNYCVYAFGVDANGNLTSTKLSYKPFTTAASTFDTSVWAGIWNVTTSKIYMEMIVNGESYQAAFLTPEEPYTRPIEIVDGASVDPSLAGYALVYGWDGAFSGLPSAGAKSYFPAWATYEGNTIQFLNEEVVYQEEGLTFQWYASWDVDGESYIVSGDYAPYKLKMEEDGSATITPYIGTLEGGSKGVVSRFQIIGIEVVDGEEGLYPGYFWTEEAGLGLPAIHFSGETMTAVKAAAEDNGGATPAPAKLSAKKNFKVMHKYANAKSAALQFSSAVKIAKLDMLAK